MNATIAINLDKRKAKKGYPVKLRITLNRHSDFISLQTFLEEEEFLKIREGKSLSPAQKIVHQKFIQAEHKALKIINEMEEYSFEVFKLKFSGKNKVSKPPQKTTIKEAFNNKIKDLKAEHKYQSAGTYSSCLAHLTDLNKSKIEVSKINLEFIKSLHSYLADLQKSNSTIIIYIKNLRAVWNLWNTNHNLPSPFKYYEFPKSETNKRSINDKELKKLLDYNGDKYFNLFKFSFYCGGMNIKDILLLKKESIEGDYIKFRRSKTGIDVKLYLLPQAKRIIDELPESNSEFLFSLIKNDFEGYMYERVKTIVKRINNRLKTACEELNIPKVTTYSARHSFATTLMNKGVSVAFISQSLGHSSITTTQNYLGSFTDEQMKNGMQQLI